MRIHCRVAVVALCFGLFLLLYFLGGNAADEPPLKQAGKGDSAPLTSAERAGGSPGEPGDAHQGSRPVRGDARRSGSRGGDALARLGPKSEAGHALSKSRGSDEVMHLAVVACGNRLDETLTMVKSALLFSVKKIKLHIFAEQELSTHFEKGLNQWPRPFSSKFQYRLYPITFSVGNAEEWKKLFKPCAAQRLFLPVILKDVDALLYVDTDVLFLRPMDDIWSFFKVFNSTQLAAMAPEHEIPKIGWYSRFARHPFFGVTGVNSGVMLMNLTRIRGTLFKNSMIATGLSWEDLLHPLYQKYKNHITWGDQDLLNIIFHYNPESLYTFPCQWNYRPDHCMYGSNCRGAEEEGVSILHGNRGVYHDDKQPAFKVVYDAIHDYPLEENLFQSLFFPLQTKFLDTVNTLCGRIPQVFLKQVEKTMRTVYERKVIRHVKAPPE
ncbi:glucoside xylosyltransferase 2 isoform X2 [Denticeps clupeoides]|uniref:glucoside xylosyltransferase 2-like isoform X2 n=1 Tax=Denticeps clupeoides TaxID=299321 RepID=UPI0010A4713F|nr:glucoside xylosyltransferase 2-like isoform X2 [Denticeps clupeoides]XP_028855249.1 glucoside xylosyltransferase 2-like isoform X2 [Denticeps clupeoides]